MAVLKYQPVPHDNKAFLAKARGKKGFAEAYDGLALEYQVAGQMLKARSRAGLTQDAVAERMGEALDGPPTLARPLAGYRMELKQSDELERPAPVERRHLSLAAEQQ